MIPTQQKKSECRIPKESIPETPGINFSFQALEFNEYFNLDMTCENWSLDLLKALKNISTLTKKDLLSGRYATYRVHNHINANPPCPLPPKVDLKDFYQIRITQSKGGVHGVFVDNTFYVIWMDPLHNLYPDDRFGGLRIVKAPTTCCGEKEERFNELQERIKYLEKENKDYEEYFAETLKKDELK